MSIPILRTKLNPPLIPANLVARPRLIKHLNEHLPQQLTLVSAPAGFGKTTLVVAWLNQVESDFCWLSLDESDNDLVHFLSYLIASLQTIDSEIGHTTLSLLQNTPGNPPVESLITTLINDISKMSSRFVLVLDDYHLIEQLLIHDALDFVLNHQPHQMHIVLITREEPALSLPRLRLRNQLDEIRTDDLRMNSEEATLFFNQVNGMNLHAEMIVTLQKRTEGWIAGLLATVLSLRGQSSERVSEFVAEFSGSHRYVMDYLISEVLQQQPDEIRTFLTQTSILASLSAPLCDAVTMRSDSQLMLTHLEQANLFLDPLDERRESYRYHRLFADVLRTWLSPEEFATLHQRAANWYEANGLQREAINHTLASGKMADLARLIERAAPAALQKGHLTIILRWLNALPDSHLNESLAILKGWTLFLRGDARRALTYARWAESKLPADATPHIKARLLTLQAFLASMQKNMRETIRLAEEAKRLVKDTRTDFYGSLLTCLGNAQQRIGHTTAAAQTFNEAISWGKEMDHAVITIVASANLAQLINLQGQRYEAIAQVTQLLRQIKTSKKTPPPITGLLNIFLGQMHYEANELSSAQSALSRGIAQSEQLGMLLFSLLGKQALALCQQAQGEQETALKTIREARQQATQGAIRPAIFLAEAIEADLQLKQGHLLKVAGWEPTAVLSRIENEIDELLSFPYVRLLLAQERFSEAQSLLTRLEQSAQTTGRKRHLITIYILQALSWDTPAPALADLEKALRLAAPQDYVRAFLDEGAKVAKLLPKVRLIAPAFVDKLMSAFQHGTSSPSLTVPPSSQLPIYEPLSERELEVLSLVGNGLSNREAAQKLFVTVGTIKKHLNNIFGKLQVKNRTQAVASARAYKLLPDSEQ